ncbi:TadE/TadG family type IV pilus assembly protein [Sphingomonas sp. RS6]
MTMPRRRHLLRDQRGSATIEFALLTVFFFVFSLLALDVAGYFLQRSQLASAVSAGSISAFANRSSVPFQSLPAYVQNASRLTPLPQVSVGCNGATGGCVNSGRSCACLSRTGTYQNVSCGSSCPAGMTAGSTAGYYMQISATTTYRALLLPKGMLNGTPITQSVTVRLQ